MARLHGFRSGFNKDEYASKGNPINGRIGPGRSLYNDDFYDDQDLFVEDSDQNRRVWDLEEMHVHHPEGQTLVGDEPTASHAGKGPKGYTRSDRLIHEDVCEALMYNSDVDATGIDVTVDKGTVFLRGEVSSRFMKHEARECMENVPGVQDVVNELRVRKPETNATYKKQKTIRGF